MTTDASKICPVVQFVMLGTSRLASQARESGLVVGVDGRSAAGTRGTATAAAEVTTGTATGATTTTSLTTATATLATTTARELATGTTAAAATLTTLAGGLDETVLELDELLLLALALALGLAAGAGEEDLILLGLDELLGVGPLLVGLGSLVGLADLEGVLLLEGKLLLGLLGEVVGIGDGLVLLLDGSLLSGGILGDGLLLLGLGDLLADDLILQLGLTLSGTPRESSLLVGTATTSTVRTEMPTAIGFTFLPWDGPAVTLIAGRGTSCATTWTSVSAQPKGNRGSSMT